MQDAYDIPSFDEALDLIYDNGKSLKLLTSFSLKGFAK